MRGTALDLDVDAAIVDICEAKQFFDCASCVLEDFIDAREERLVPE